MSNRIIGFIENANKVLFFLAAIIVIGVIGKEVISDIFRSGHSGAQVQVIEEEHLADKDNEIKVKISLKKRYLQKIKDIYLFEITSDAIVDKSSSGSSFEMFSGSSYVGLSPNAVNLMFTKVGEESKLLLPNNALIVDFSTVTDESEKYSDRLSKNVYLIVHSDTNGDGFLNANDNKELLISEYDGSNLKPVINEVLSYSVVGDDNLIIHTFSNNNDVYYAFDLLSGKLSALDTKL